MVAALNLLSVAPAESYCLPPTRPFAPENVQALTDYADIIVQDFDLYFRDAQAYLRCLDEERARVVIEAADVTNEYRHVWEALRRAPQ